MNGLVYRSKSLQDERLMAGCKRMRSHNIQGKYDAVMRPGIDIYALDRFRARLDMLLDEAVARRESAYCSIEVDQGAVLEGPSKGNSLQIMIESLFMHRVAIRGDNLVEA